MKSVDGLGVSHVLKVSKGSKLYQPTKNLTKKSFADDIENERQQIPTVNTKHNISNVRNIPC